jgi:toxin YoeB
MTKTWGDQTWEEYISWQGQDRKTLWKINALINDIDRNGYECTGQPERLKGDSPS